MLLDEVDGVVVDAVDAVVDKVEVAVVVRVEVAVEVSVLKSTRNAVAPMVNVNQWILKACDVIFLRMVLVNWLMTC